MDLLESLTVEGVAELQLIFERNDGLTSDTFVKVFRSLLEKESQPDAIFRWTSTALRAFFAEIDVDGNGKVDWEEFTDFVISSRKHVGYQPSQRGIRLQLDVGPSAVSLFPNQCAHLHRLIYFSDVSKAIAASVSRITVHDMSSAGYPTIATLSVPGKMSDAVYIAENACIAVSTESGDLACFDTSSDFREIGSYRAHMPILRLCAPRNSSVLVGGDSSGFLNILERNRVCTRSFTNSVYLPKGKKYHTSAVVSLFTTPKALVTVGMDATIHLVDLETNTSLYSLPTFHTKLIRDAALNDYESNIIVTCGEGSRAGVLFADHRHQSPAYLEDSVVPHGGQLAGVSTVVGKCEVASVDELGMIKLWDLRMLRCLTTAFVPHTIERKMEDVCGSALPKSISGITCTESKAYILGPSVCSYNRHECGVSVSTHEEPIVAVAYIQTSQLIVTCTCTEIAVWSVRSGVKQSTFFTQVADRTMGGSITSMSVDKTHNSRRLIIGTHNGYILSLLIASGVVQWSHLCGNAYADGTSDNTGRYKIAFAEMGAFKNIIFGLSTGCVASIRENYLSEGVRFIYVPDALKTTFQNVHLSRQLGHELSKHRITRSGSILPAIVHVPKRLGPSVGGTGFNCYAFSSICGTILAYSLSENILLAIDVREKRAACVGTLCEEVTAITFVAEFAPEVDGNSGSRLSSFAVGTVEGEIHIWTFKSHDVTSRLSTVMCQTLSIPEKHMCSGLCSVQNRYLIASCESTETVVWDLADPNEPLTTYTIPHANSMCSALLCPLGKSGVFAAASVGVDPTVALCVADGQIAGWMCAARTEISRAPDDAPPIPEPTKISRVALSHVKHLARQLVEKKNITEVTTDPKAKEVFDYRGPKGLPVYNLLNVLNERGLFISTRELPSISNFRRTKIEENEIVSQRRANATRSRKRAKYAPQAPPTPKDFIDDLISKMSPNEPSQRKSIPSGKSESIEAPVLHTRKIPVKPSPRQRVRGGLSGNDFGDNSFHKPSVISKAERK